MVLTRIQKRALSQLSVMGAEESYNTLPLELLELLMICSCELLVSTDQDNGRIIDDMIFSTLNQLIGMWFSY